MFGWAVPSKSKSVIWLQKITSEKWDVQDNEIFKVHSAVQKSFLDWTSQA